MDDNSFYIPQYLDEPQRFLLWTIDEASAFFVPLFIGLIGNHSALGLFMGIACMVGIKKFKTAMGSGYKRWLYWHCPAVLINLRGTPSSAVREYIG